MNHNGYRNCLPQEQMGNISEGVCYFARITRVGYEKILAANVRFLFCYAYSKVQA